MAGASRRRLAAALPAGASKSSGGVTAAGTNLRGGRGHGATEVRVGTGAGVQNPKVRASGASQNPTLPDGRGMRAAGRWSGGLSRGQVLLSARRSANLKQGGRAWGLCSPRAGIDTFRRAEIDFLVAMLVPACYVRHILSPRLATSEVGATC
jgi:hypothetical protein